MDEKHLSHLLREWAAEIDPEDDDDGAGTLVLAADAIDAQTERIRALEVDRASWQDVVRNRLETEVATARRETATAIMRFAMTYAAETKNDAGQRVKVIGVDELVSVCRAHGVDV